MRNAHIMQELVDTLKALTPEQCEQHYNLGYWLVSPFNTPNRPNPLSCGSSACSAGWLASLPSAQAAGLKMSTSDFTGASPVIEFESEKAFSALVAFFSITYENARYLFGTMVTDPDTDEDYDTGPRARDLAVVQFEIFLTEQEHAS